MNDLEQNAPKENIRGPYEIIVSSDGRRCKKEVVRVMVYFLLQNSDITSILLANKEINGSSLKVWAETKKNRFIYGYESPIEYKSFYKKRGGTWYKRLFNDRGRINRFGKTEVAKVSLLFAKTENLNSNPIILDAMKYFPENRLRKGFKLFVIKSYDWKRFEEYKRVIGYKNFRKKLSTCLNDLLSNKLTNKTKELSLGITVSELDKLFPPNIYVDRIGQGSLF